MIFHCIGCGVRFKRDHPNRPAKHCSIACRSLNERKVKPQTFREFVETGAKLEDIAERFDMSVNRVRFWIRQDGLYNTWRARRFECAEPLMVGNGSLTTASGVVTTRSAA